MAAAESEPLMTGSPNRSGNTTNHGTFAETSTTQDSPSGGAHRRLLVEGVIHPVSPSEEPGGNDDSDPPDKDNDSAIRMKKELGVMDGVGVIVGIIVGSGIFISPTGVVEYTGSVAMSLIVWGLTGLLSMVGAICYAELGCMIPKSGGDYAYIYAAFGDLPSFLFLWVALIIIMPTGNTVIALTFANYALQPFFPNCDSPPDVAVRLLAALVICFLTYINCVNVKLVTKITDVFTATKVMALLVIIVTGLVYFCQGSTENYKKPFEGTNWSVFAIATAFYQGIFSFAGWNYLNFIVEELKDPSRSLPRAILISLPTVTIIYFLTNMAYFVVLSPAEVMASSAVAVTFGERTLGSMSWIIPVFVVCSTFGSLNGGIFASSRLFFVGARQGHLPASLALINVDHYTPVPSLLFLGMVTCLMLVSSDIQSLINYISFTEALFILLSISALLWMRYKYPDKPRPIKVWLGFPIFFFCVCLFLVVLPVIERPIELGVAAAVLFAGVPVYYLFIARKASTDVEQKCINRCTSIVQLLTQSVAEEKQD